MAGKLQSAEESRYLPSWIRTVCELDAHMFQKFLTATL